LTSGLWQRGLLSVLVTGIQYHQLLIFETGGEIHNEKRKNGSGSAFTMRRDGCAG
jgi:hypothetical protein